MKKVLIFIGILVAGFQLLANEKIEIPAMKSVDLTYEQFARYDVKLSNKSGKEVIVSVVNPATERKVSGFGLGPFGNAVVYVAEGNILKLKNTSTKDMIISLSFVEREQSAVNNSTSEWIQLTLHNSSLKSIPLIIPTVMNPNLSPMSNSGVSLQMGQKVYYKTGLSKELLFTVDESFSQGDKIDIAKLVKKLK